MAVSRTVARILLSFIFVIGGLQKFIYWHSESRDWTLLLQNVRGDLKTVIPQFPQAVEYAEYILLIAATLELGGGLAIMFGGDRCGAIMCSLFLLGVTPIMHYPIKNEGPDPEKMAHALKNIALLGAMILLYSSVRQQKNGKKKGD